MRSIIITVSILVSIQILGCFGATPNSRLNFFDIDLLESTAEDKTGNVVISPASVKSTLAMILEGAEGDTATEIKSALRVSQVKDDFRKELNMFLEALEVNTTNVLLRNANAIFVSKKLSLKKQYESAVKGIYFTEVAKLDFDNPRSSVDTINRWVSDKTQGLIPSIVNEGLITPSTELLLTNALYFKASWKYAFDAKLTKSDCFYVKGICRNVAMMDLQAELKYAFVNDLKAHALELPYQGGRYSMLLLVPQYRDSTAALIRDLPYIGIPQIIDTMEPTDVVITMPKFTIEYSADLNEALKKIRINALFSQSANLSGIFDLGDSAYVSSIYQSVYMKVDEAGTEAAASTIAFVVPLINNQVQIRVDRSFLFFIRDNTLGLNLFEGKIEEPTEYTEPNNNKGQPSKAEPVSIESLTSQVKPLIFTSRRAISELAGSSYVNFNQANQANQNQTSVQLKQDSYQTNTQTTPTEIATTKPTDASLSKSNESEKSKSSSGISGWFKSIKQVFTGGSR